MPAAASPPARSSATRTSTPEQAIPLALLCFDLGIELGQLAFALAVVVPVAAAVRLLPKLRWPAALPGYGLGALAGYWTIERTIGFWS